MSRRMSRRRRRLAGLIATTALMLGAAAPALADPPVWRVNGRTTVTLIPTTPTVPADARWKTPAIREAAAGARQLWFINPFGLPGPITAIRLLGTINAHGYLPPGQHLSSRLSAEGRTKLAQAAARYSVDPGKLDRMAPWYAFVTLSLAQQKKTGAADGLPVERYVIANAPAGTPKHGFDNLENDMKLLVATPEPEQVYDLETFLKSATDPAVDRAYAAAWANGDLGWIAKERDAPLKAAAPVTYQTMQILPRRRWADQIARLAQGSEPVVVMLDAADFVGPNGLPALLRARGLKVEES